MTADPLSVSPEARKELDASAEYFGNIVGPILVLFIFGTAAVGPRLSLIASASVAALVFSIAYPRPAEEPASD